MGNTGIAEANTTAMQGLSEENVEGKKEQWKEEIRTQESTQKIKRCAVAGHKMEKEVWKGYVKTKL